MVKKEEKFEGGSSGTDALYAFFTPEKVVDKMWALAYHYGFEGGTVLDPAAGSGRLLAHAPDYSKVEAFEVVPATYIELQKTYPGITAYQQPFETAFLEAPRFNSRIKSKSVPSWLKGYPFDLVIANPPYVSLPGCIIHFSSSKGNSSIFL